METGPPTLYDALIGRTFSRQRAATDRDCRRLWPILTEVYSYCKGKDCKKHTLHKVTQCEYPLIMVEYAGARLRC